MYYLKYRPQKFSELSKPNDTALALSNQVKSSKTAHAYLFVGPRGTGKTATARILAKALNCPNVDEHGDPCNKCDSCLAIKNGSYLDLIEIDAASNRGIDDIRQLKEKINLAPSVGKRKVYIIDEVHMLTTEAFNALLKTLEEPPRNVTFILCTTELHKVPDTIKSRCEVFKFKRASLEQLTKKLKQIAEREKANISEQTIRKIAISSHGGFRDAETLLQQIIEGEIDSDSIFSLGTKDIYSDFFGMLIENNPKDSINFIGKLYEDGVDLHVWVGEFIKYLRELMLIKADAYSEQFDISDDLLSRMKSLAEKIMLEKLLVIMEKFIKAQNDIKSSFITQLPIEMAIVSVCDINEKPMPIKQDVSPSQLPPLNNLKSKLATGSQTTTENEKVSDMPSKSFNNSKANMTDPSPNTVYKLESSLEELRSTKKVVDVETLVDEETALDDRELEAEAAPTVGTTVEIVESFSDKATVTLETIVGSWKTIIKEVADVNNTVSALLKTAQVTSVVGRKLVVEVPFDFHKERLEAEKNRKIVENAISSILEHELYITCSVKRQEKKGLKEKETGKLTDYNIIPSNLAAKDFKGELLEVFDGGLPFN